MREEPLNVNQMIDEALNVYYMREEPLDINQMIEEPLNSNHIERGATYC